MSLIIKVVMLGRMAFVGKTDFGWFSFLRQRQNIDEVNFWRPSDRGFQAIPQNSPYLFELKSPHRAIGGFGFFTRFERLPLWLAWDTFDVANGAQDLPTLVKDIGRNRDSGPTSDQTEIGCIMVRDALFFEDKEFIRLPPNWLKNIQVGKLLDIADAGEGNRIWQECLDRAVARRHDPVVGLPEQRRRYTEERLFRQRLGQGSFRIGVSDAYGWACAVTCEHSRPALEAAHIKPFAREGEHDVRNGLLLRSDFHRLYDRGYVTVTPDYGLLVGDALRRDFSNGRSYYPLNGQSISLPANPSLRPDQNLLAWHKMNVFGAREVTLGRSPKL